MHDRPGFELCGFKSEWSCKQRLNWNWIWLFNSWGGFHIFCTIYIYRLFLSLLYHPYPLYVSMSSLFSVCLGFPLWIGYITRNPVQIEIRSQSLIFVCLHLQVSYICADIQNFPSHSMKYEARIILFVLYIHTVHMWLFVCVCVCICILLYIKLYFYLLMSSGWTYKQ